MCSSSFVFLSKNGKGMKNKITLVIKSKVEYKKRRIPKTINILVTT